MNDNTRARLAELSDSRKKPHNKFYYGFNICQRTSQGWEVVNFETTYRAARRSLKEYQDNQPEYPARMSYGRHPNPAHQAV